MDKIRPNLWIGNMEDAKNVNLLKASGITAVLNVAWDCSDPEICPAEILWTKCGLIDDKGNPMPRVRMAIGLLNALLNEQHTVMIHCRAGASRAPYIVARCLATREKKSFDQVLANLKSLRPCVNRPNRLVEFYGTGEEGLPPVSFEAA